MVPAQKRVSARGSTGLPAVTPFPFVTETMEKAVAALVGSIPQLKPYMAIKGKARAEWRHHIQTIMRERLVDPEAVVVVTTRLMGACTSVLPGRTR